MLLRCFIFRHYRVLLCSLTYEFLSKDKREKKYLYERFGVKEYIIVYPEREYVERYSLENNKYGAPELFNWDEVLKLRSFEIEINLWEIFEKERQIAVGEGKA